MTKQRFFFIFFFSSGNAAQITLGYKGIRFFFIIMKTRDRTQNSVLFCVQLVFYVSIGVFVFFFNYKYCSFRLNYMFLRPSCLWLSLIRKILLLAQIFSIQCSERSRRSLSIKFKTIYDEIWKQRINFENCPITFHWYNM